MSLNESSPTQTVDDNEQYSLMLDPVAEASYTDDGFTASEIAFAEADDNYAIVDARDVSQIVLKLLDSEESGEKYLLIGHNMSFLSLFTEMSKAFTKSKPSIRLNQGFATFLAYTIENTYRIFRKRSPISIESIQSAYKNLEYSNSKVSNRFDYTFYSIEDTFDNAIKGRFND